MATSTTPFPSRTIRFFDGTNLRVAVFVTASVLTHVVFTYVLPDYVAPEAPPPAPIDFAVLVEPEEVEPEPILEEEPPEPEPVVERVIEEEIVEEEIVEEVEDVIEETPDEELAHEAEVNDEALADASPHTADAIAGTVNSTEGGLTVARRAGSGRDGGALGREPRVAPARPRVGIDRRRIVREYLREVQRALGAPRFTRALQRAEVEGVVMVGLRIDPAGHVHAVRVKESSGHGLIDEAALAHVQQVSEVPAPPDVLDWITREITLPVRYVRRAQR